MKKLAPLILALALSVPAFAAAQANAPDSPYSDGSCFGPSDCNSAAGYTCDTSTDTCTQGSANNNAGSNLPGGNANGNGLTNNPSAPSNGSGAGGINTAYLQGYSNSIIGIINNLFVPVLIAIAFITFLFGVYKYFILGAANPEERKAGAQFVLWGIIGFVIIIAVWGLVAIVGQTLNLSPGGSAPALPKL
ncbi:hypothetical protein HY091_02120 [Candidatus Kaiserbacteria bacterium]|nr:hypothetical protein [Candidatus Kaiserbacteria bacterium]